MIILGIHDGHCATACIMIDGTLKALAAEERFTRVKNDHGYPYHAIEFCLERLNLSAADIDVVAFAAKRMNIFAVKLKAISCFSTEDWLTLEHQYWRPLLYEGIHNNKSFEEIYNKERFQKLEHFYDFSGLNVDEAMTSDLKLSNRIRLDGLKRHLGIESEKVAFFDHHTCHAAYALFSSNIRNDNTMIFTLDGGGDATTSSLFRFRNGKLQELARSNDVSVARIYRYITLLLGMKLGEHEYKVMGLAPYAPRRERLKSWEVYDGIFHVKNDMILYRDGRKPPDMYFHFQKAFEGHRFDGIAAATQKMVEESVTAWVTQTMQKYRSRHAVFAGGVAMNVKLNMLLAESRAMDDFYVPPSPSDDTLSIGASYLAELEKDALSYKKFPPITDPYQGPDFTREDIENAIKKTGAYNRYQTMESITSSDIADYLTAGKVVARLGNKMEFGQRALGNRSILADPRKEYMVDKINHQIKYRDFWMPFAPAIIEGYDDVYFKSPKNKNSMTWSYMMFGAETTDIGSKDLIAAIHRGDYTGRPQLVREKDNPGFYAIIKAFEERTGTGAVLNTSFNLHGEPIVCSPEDAISTFDRSELDVLAMEDIALVRNG